MPQQIFVTLLNYVKKEKPKMHYIFIASTSNRCAVTSYHYASNLYTLTSNRCAQTFSEIHSAILFCNIILIYYIFSFVTLHYNNFYLIPQHFYNSYCSISCKNFKLFQQRNTRSEPIIPYDLNF